MKRYFVDFAMGFTWVILDATVVHVYDYEGGPCAHTQMIDIDHKI